MRRRRKTPPAYRNPKYEPAYRQARSGRMPLTLVDASTRASLQRDLDVIAASFQSVRPCYAQALRRFAQQAADSYTAAQAVAAYTSTPSHNESASERTLADPSLAEAVFGETGSSDPGV